MVTGRLAGDHHAVEPANAKDETLIFQASGPGRGACLRIILPLCSQSRCALLSAARVYLPKRMLRTLGRHTLNLVQAMGDFALFTGISFRSAIGSRKIIRRIARAAFEQGTRCLPVILIVGMFTGLVPMRF